jgi:hypothetical protein
MDGEVKVSILQWENLRKEIGELTEENARLKTQQGQIKLTLVDKEYGGSFKYNRFSGRNEFIPEGKDVETTQYVNMDNILKVLKEEAEDNVASDVEKFKQDIYRLKQEQSKIIEEQADYVNELKEENKIEIELLEKQSKKEKEELEESFKKEKKELEESFEKTKKILQEKIVVLQRVIDGAPLTEKEIIDKLQEKIRELEKNIITLKDKIPFWRR